MRKNETNTFAGNCCCLIPVIILIAIVLVSLIAVGVLDTHRSWNRSPDHSSLAYQNGYRSGAATGESAYVRDAPAPNVTEIDALAVREADKSHVTHDRRQWLRGFRSGFTHGFKRASKQARAHPVQDHVS